jgi:threonine/homoserine/homoserine lactone efflux protein
MNPSRIFITGLIISFLGTLPLGTLNIAAMQISVTDGIRPAIYFAIGALLVEIIYVRVSLVAMDWVRRQQTLFHWLEWFTVLIVAALAFSSFLAAADPDIKKNVLLSDTFHRFWLGVVMSAVNPMQIPFWFGWSTVLITKKILQPSNKSYNIYIVGIGVGTFIGNLVFIFGGRLIVDRLNNNQHVLHYIIGSIFAITAIIMLVRLLRKKDMMHQIDHPEEVTHGLEDKVTSEGFLKKKAD